MSASTVSMGVTASQASNIFFQPQQAKNNNIYDDLCFNTPSQTHDNVASSLAFPQEDEAFSSYTTIFDEEAGGHDNDLANIHLEALPQEPSISSSGYLKDNSYSSQQQIAIGNEGHGSDKRPMAQPHHVPEGDQVAQTSPSSNHSQPSSNEVLPPSTSRHPASIHTTSPPDESSPSSDPQARKRHLNTLAARRCRQRRTDKTQNLAGELKETRVERDRLKLQVAHMEGEMRVLRQMLSLRTSNGAT